MANNTASRPPRGRDAADRSRVLRNVMEVLSEKGFARTSIADLRNSAGLGYAALHKTFGTREEILRAAIRFCAETEASWRTSLCACRRPAEKPFSRCWKRMCGCVGIGQDTVAAFLPPTPLSFRQKRMTCRSSSSRRVSGSRSTSVHGSCNR